MEKVITEAPETIQRYETLKELGKEFFSATPITQEGVIKPPDVQLIKSFVSEAITQTGPEVWASYLEHVVIAPELGTRIAEAVSATEQHVDSNLIEGLLWLHDIGRLVTPGAYFRNDLIDLRLLREFGFPPSLTDHMFRLDELLETADSLAMTEDQISFKKGLDERQTALAQAYFDALSPEQRIINLADNLGKRGEKGIFGIDEFMRYLQSQEDRYEHTSRWPSVEWAIERRQQGAVLQAFVIRQTIQWLSELGVDVESIMSGMHDYGPRFIVVVRHGELDNQGRLYNRDSVMKPEDIVHLNETGQLQMRSIGTLIKTRKFRVNQILHSPQTRTLESAYQLNISLGLPDDAVSGRDDLDEVFAPGPYKENLTMKEWVVLHGNCYDEKRWGEYHHEPIDKITQRGRDVFWQTAAGMTTGEAAVLISHGDPIAWMLNSVSNDEVPDPEELRQKIYPNKGDGFIVIIGPDGKVFSHYTLTDKSLPKGTSF